MKWWSPPAIVALSVAIALAAALLFVVFGMRAGQPEQITPTPAPSTLAVTEVITLPTTTLPETTPPTPEITPVPTPTRPRTYVAPAIPFHDRIYYKLPYYSTVYNPKGNLPPTIFHQSYEGKFQDEAVIANVLEAPLIIDFVLTQSQTPTRSFFFLTVRNNATQELLTQEGFFGPYSENRQKRLYFSSPGSYHINMYGAFVTVDLTIRAPT